MGHAINGDDVRGLRHWYTSLTFQDPRFEDGKGLLKLAALTMVHDDLRSRLVHDTESVLREFRTKLPLPEGVTLRFWENTSDTLHIVLPPRAGEMSERHPEVREVLRSRTQRDSALTRGDTGGGSYFGDDWAPADVGDPIDDFGHIDYGDRSKDH
ncbi:hypothetical protein [Streptomyces sp. NPDC059651]|uniref:hypothetical protein n=1 Tax=unclassified Streptomyces TaxID=2593676 RepID=UPI0036BD858D